MPKSWEALRASTIIDQFKDVRGGLLPALHALQEEFGFVDDSAIPVLATAFNQTSADVFGVITYYHDFKRTRPGRYTIKVCRGEACQAMGAEELIADIKRRLKVEVGAKTADGEFSLDQVFCLGNCALSPAVMVDHTLYGRVSADRMDKICKGLRA
jgi:formate dehydrogenase subunit gamma